MDVERTTLDEPEAKCKNTPICEYGKPYRNGILSCCEWCKLAVECFLIAGRDYEGELLAREEFAKTCYTLPRAEKEDVEIGEVNLLESDFSFLSDFSPRRVKSTTQG